MREAPALSLPGLSCPVLSRLFPPGPSHPLTGCVRLAPSPGVPLAMLLPVQLLSFPPVPASGACRHGHPPVGGGEPGPTSWGRGTGASGGGALKSAQRVCGRGRGCRCGHGRGCAGRPTRQPCPRLAPGLPAQLRFERGPGRRQQHDLCDTPTATFSFPPSSPPRWVICESSVRGTGPFSVCLFMLLQTDGCSFYSEEGHTVGLLLPSLG